MERDEPKIAWAEELRRGGRLALSEAFDQHRGRLRRMVQYRMDVRLRSRLDASDVLQEAFLEAARRLERAQAPEGVPLYVWLRGLTWDQILALHRRHLGAQKRSICREIPAETSIRLGKRLLSLTSPSESLLQEELQRRVQDALGRLTAEDREVLLMRHIEDMTNAEVASVLGLTEPGASMRYGRALSRLRSDLTRHDSSDPS
ncbi:MAG: sigma-70 family RNA polymerase sigma factor [Planctomycetota bacterium]